MRERNDYKGVPDMREIRKFIKSISGHKNFDPNYYSSEVLTMTNLVYSLFNFDFIFERQKKNGYGANKYRFFWGKIRGVVSYTLYITTKVYGPWMTYKQKSQALYRVRLNTKIS